MTPEEFAAKVPQFKPKVWKRRVYLTPPSWRAQAGFVDFTSGEPRIQFKMDASDAAAVRAALGMEG